MTQEKRPRRLPSLAAKFILLTGSLIVVTSTIITAYVIRDQIRHSHSDLVTHGMSVSVMIAQNSEYGVYTRNRDNLRQIAESCGTDPDILYVAILDRKGKVLAQSTREPSMRIPSGVRWDGDADAPSHAEFVLAGRRYVDVRTPVLGQSGSGRDEALVFGGLRDAPEVIGHVRLGLNVEGVQRRLRQFVYSISVFTFVLISVGIVLTILVTRKITSPVRALTKATQDISEGRFEGHIEIDTHDEISGLSRSFNHMLARLRSFRAQVEERTEELSAANRQMAVDIEERRRAEESTLAAKARLEHLLTSSPGVVYSCQPRGDYTVTFISENVKLLLGYEPEEFISDPRFWVARIHPDETPEVLAKMNQLFERDRHVHEYRFRHGDGTYRWMRDELRLVRDAQGSPLEIIGYWIDITDKKQLEEQLIHDAFHDALTGLPNRALFMDRLGVAFVRAKRQTDYLFAVLYLDLDRFKNVNDSLGHVTGDELLLAVAKRLQSGVRACDSVARLGGDEFAVILEDIGTITDALAITGRVHAAMELPFTVASYEVFTTVSIGIAMNHPDYARPEQLLRDADTAMYRAKALGRACHVVFDEAMHAQAVASLQLETDMRRAIDRNEFLLYYQPIISLSTGAVTGFEALLRWRHPARGILTPDQFLRIAEETGLIVPIGRWALWEACRKLRLWQTKFPARHPLTMSVNLSGKHFTSSLVEDIRHVLDETELTPESLRLEITETMVIETPESAAALLAELKNIGVQVYIDDFGTGYSSMNYLQMLPIDALKIDRSFVHRMVSDEETLEIIKTIITLAHALHMDVIAEGVETEDQMERLGALRCEYAQGCLIARPMDGDSAESFLSAAGPHPAPGPASDPDSGAPSGA